MADLSHDISMISSGRLSSGYSKDALIYRSSREMKLHSRFNLKKTQRLFNTFRCTLEQLCPTKNKSIHTHGKMYLFTDFVCFHANKNTTKSSISLCIATLDISTIARATTARILQNAIKITCKDGTEHMFRAFFNREKAFDQLQRLLKLRFRKSMSQNGSNSDSEIASLRVSTSFHSKPKYSDARARRTRSEDFAVAGEEVIDSEGEFDKFFRDEFSDENESAVARASRLSSVDFSKFQILPLKYDILQFESIFTGEIDCSLNTFWDLFWSTEAKFSIFDYVANNPDVSNLSHTKWQAEKETKNWQFRTTKFTLKLKDLPSFVPKHVTVSKVETKERFTRPQDNVLLIHRIVNVKEVPMCDYYTVHEKLELRQNAIVVNLPDGKHKVNLSCNFEVSVAFEWHKSPFKMIKNGLMSNIKTGIKKDYQKYKSTIERKIFQFKNHNINMTKLKQPNKSVIKPKRKVSFAQNNLVKTYNLTHSDGSAHDEYISSESSPSPSSSPSASTNTLANSSLKDNTHQLRCVQQHDFLLKFGNSNTAVQFEFGITLSNLETPSIGVIACILFVLITILLLRG